MQFSAVRLATAMGLFAGLLSGPAMAADWSDNAIGYRYGTRFAEPYVSSDIHKHIVNFTHASGNQYGSNYLNIDVLQSDRRDDDATEAYLVYRYTLDVGKVSGKDFRFGPVRGFGLTAGVDLNTKNDPGYSSRKRMLVAGPTLMFDVPGFLNVSVLALWESNRPVGVSSRYEYDLHPMLAASWNIPLWNEKWSFEGYLNYIGAKGLNEFGGPTAPETNIDMQLMYDVSSAANLKPKSLKVGLEYQYWRNKFGNPSNVPGSTASTPMVRAEYHF
ncbi:hypothetical protein EDC30_107105 [Paucimonas lemoignei]|uniref:Nucleoside-specific outer membrane channel protein Tsx n=1 Tax=Paucimonas lemoignei TaxID=29443 RepID=A0A4R3HTH6_PAULE|nr:outer envelope protein [Paucimonas lemoignei]TCS36288.1 hypothetical protein EDC30_107105 [Paucimonas lemoignei]